jgi:hypothetical protein
MPSQNLHHDASGKSKSFAAIWRGRRRRRIQELEAAVDQAIQNEIFSLSEEDIGEEERRTL